jgi:hypothetical protein
LSIVLYLRSLLLVENFGLRPSNHYILVKVIPSVGFLGPRANAELVPKFHVALHASHAALPMVALEISHSINVTSKYGDLALQVGGVSDETVK